MKLLKRIGALVLTLALVVGGLPMAYLSVNAGNDEPSVLTIVNGGSTYLNLKGTDSLWESQGDMYNMLSPADSESGIITNDGSSPYWLNKSHGQNCWYAVAGLGEKPAVAGTTITIKGTFKSSSNETVVFEESTFKFDGTEWTKVIPTQEPSVLTIVNGASTYLNLKGTDKLWETEGDIYNMLSPADSESGITINDGSSPYWLNKSHGQNCWYAVAGLGEKPAVAGTTITIKGTFKSSSNETVVFETSTFVFDGNVWSKKSMDITEFKATTFGSVAQPTFVAGANSGEGNWHVYLKSDVALPETAAGDYLNGFQISVNSGEPVGIVAFTGDNGGLIFYIPETVLSSPLTNDTTVTLKAGEATAVGGGQKYKLTQDFPMYFSSSDIAWSTKFYDKITLTGFLDNSTCVENAGGDGVDMWSIFLNTSQELSIAPGTGSYSGLKGKVEVGQRTEDIDITLSSEATKLGWFSIWSPTLSKEDEQTGFKITIYKGKGEPSDSTCNGIQLTEDFTLYRNQYGWSTTGFIKPKVHSTFTFTGIDTDNTKYAPGSGVDDGRWDVFLNTSAILPGTAGAGQYFAGMKAKLQIGEGGEQEISVNIWNEAESKIWIPLYDVKQDINTIKNFKLTICKGKADSSVVTNDGIELTEDYTIYVNEYGISSEGYVKAPVYDKIVFTGYTDDSGCVVNADGQGNDMWSFLVKTSQTLSIKPKEGSYSGLKAKLVIGGVETTTDITLISEADKVGWFSIWSPTLSKKDEEKGIKLTICKGTAKASVEGCNGIELTEDFTIYINQYGWSTTELKKEPAYTKFTFNSINSVTAFNEKEDAWDIYLAPSTTLPGTADSTMYNGLKMSVNGGEAFGLNVVKSAHAGTAFMRVSSENLPKKFKGNTEIVISAAKATAKDGSAIWLTQDFVIYANQYGWSVTGYLSAPSIKQKDAKVALDRAVSYGGNKKGIYLTTTDIFPVDTSWGTHIKAVQYEENSGVFLNGKKLDSASIIRYTNGKAYISLSDIGLEAKDHDVLTVKGTFALNGTGVVYKEATFHFNGKIWNNTYEAPKPETYKDFNIKSVNLVSGYLDSQKQWNLYFDVDTTLPGNIDQMHFYDFTVQIGSKTITTWGAHSYNHTLYIPIAEADLAKNCPDGTKITIKAGKALGDDQSSGINLVKDFVIYTYKGSIFTEKPTTNTDWQNVSVSQLIRTGSYNKDAECWQMFIKLQEELKTESDTRYLQFPIVVNGKEHKVTAVQEGIYLYVPIGSNILPENAKTATITIKSGAESTANAGYNGIKFTEDWNAYLFNGAISEVKFTKVEEIETAIIGLQAVTADPTVSHVYLRLNKEFPGSSWYEYYNDFVYYYNGKRIETYICKADSSNGKVMYFTINTNTLGEPKEGDIIEIRDGEDITCGGYHVTLTKGFKMIFKDGVWSEFVESDEQKPADNESLWSLARFDSAYIPVAEEDGAVLFSGEDEYPQINSLKKMKDFTVSFTSKKAYDDEIANTFKVILRGNPISETDEMTSTLLYGYVITFSPMEIPNPLNPEETVWSGYLELWKNGENMALTDQYRIHYEHERVNNPFFKYNEEYDYEFSIYNVTDTTVCIEAKVNGVTIMRHYDEASSDPMDPAVNDGTFAIIGAGPNYIKDDIVELSAVIAEKDECETGEEVRVAATYPSVIKGAEFAVDKKGAIVENGVFKAEKEGTYTISCTYEGKELETKTITVTKAAKTDAESENFPVVPVVIGTVSTLLLAAIITFVVIKNKNKKQSAK